MAELGQKSIFHFSIRGLTLITSIAAVGDAGDVGSALAQAVNGGDVGDVVVVATTTQQPPPDKSTTVTRLTSKTLDALGATKLNDIISVTPGVFMPQTGITPSHVTIFMRGMGELDQQGHPSVALYLDDVYLPRTLGANLDLLDIDTIDIARGPQGFAYGHSAEAGTINVHTKQPTDTLTETALVGYGSYNEVRSAAIVSGPIIKDEVYGSLAIEHHQRDGYTYDVTNGHHGNNLDTTDFRAKLRFTPTEKLDITTTFDATLDDGDAVLWGDLSRSTNPNIAFSNIDPWNKYHELGVSTVGTYAFTDQLKLKSITAYRSFDDYAAFDNTGDPYAQGIGLLGYSDVFVSQETRLAGDFQRFNFSIGNWASNEDWIRQGTNNGSSTLNPNPNLSTFLPVYTLANQEDKEFAFFGQGTFKATDKLSLTFGGRWNYNYQYSNMQNYSLGPTSAYKVTGYIPDQELLYAYQDYTIGSVPGGTTLNWIDNGSQAWTRFTPKVNVDYQWTPDLATYATFSKGEKDGGFDYRGYSPTGSSQLQDSLAFGPEVVTNYEVGFRSSFLSERVTLNGDAFYDDVSGVQLTTTDPVTLISHRFNAGTGRSKGIELESSVNIVPNLNVSLSGTYLDARLNHFDGVAAQTTYANGLVLNTTPFNGARLPNSPTWQGYLGATYAIPVNAPGQYLIGGNAQYKSFTYNDALNNTVNRIPDQTTFNGFVSYTTPDKRWIFRVDAENILDDRYPQWLAYTVQPKTGTLLYYGVFYNEPRLVVGSVRYVF
ncbi:hypothetical protein CWB41_13490 [Methylovirgula ligni]|uniref:Iron complex outermembrane receptor protein n=1 Tax=Methylovirgula ligni TaxID=569860 RepID=A0A3D9YNC4_9HYPH|nr:TonB-dependent receptor [Methylovirgula ligni]QAY96618.1 hypothetical protein CWB41_13490 [Methylovirgula ligni]REF84067.1 iron complex outermembrane receptor protein [Methylovirgula ligni]